MIIQIQISECLTICIQKGLKAYKRLGYSIQVRKLFENQTVNSIFDYETYVEIYNNDLFSAKKNIVISSPSFSYKKIKTFINSIKDVQEHGVEVTVLTLNPESYVFDNFDYKIHMIKSLQAVGIEVVLHEDNCFHFTIIDNNIVWYGSVNLLGKEDMDDNIMRIDSEEIAAELLELSYKTNLPN